MSTGLTAETISEFRVRVASDDLVFSAAHFITWGSTACERLHGHTYRAAAEVFGPLDGHQCVVDFTILRAVLKEILAELDHRVILPTEHSALRVTKGPSEVEASFDQRRWIFPSDNCLLLPIANTTTELLAAYVGQRLRERLAAQGISAAVQIELGEGTGASAVCRLPG